MRQFVPKKGGLEIEKEHWPILSATVANLSKMTEGKIVAEELTFPTTKEQVQSLLERIGVDGIRSEEVIFTDFSSPVKGLAAYLGEHENLDELNYMSCLLKEVLLDEREKLEAVLESNNSCSGAPVVINLVENLDKYGFYPGIGDEESLGRYLLEEAGYFSIPDFLRSYIDYEAYGRDYSLSTTDCFSEKGYVEQIDSLEVVYHGKEDIPEEYQVFAYPELTVREQMARYKEVIERDSSGSHTPARELHCTER